MLKKSFYADYLRLESSDKDSNFEPCTILEYDSKTMLAKVIGNNSKQVRGNVPVLHSSLFLNAGMVSPPVKFSTGILFWGAERNCYLFPAQFLPATRSVLDGEKKMSASPGQIETFFSFENVEGGEHFIRALSGNYVHVKNNDSIVVSTSDLQRIQLDASGLYLLADAERKHCSGVTSYAGPVGETESQFKLVVSRKSDEAAYDVSLADIPNIENASLYSLSAPEETPSVAIQYGGVYKLNGTTEERQVSEVDESNVVVDLDVFDSSTGEKTLNLNISEKGAIHSFLENDEYSTKMIIRPGGIQFIFVNKSTTEVLEEHFGFGW